MTYRKSVPNYPSWLNPGYTTDIDLIDPPGQEVGIGAYVDPTGLPVGTYSTALHLVGDFSGSPVIIPVTLTVLAPGSSLPSSQPHPEGTNVSTPDGTVYKIIFGVREPYTSAGAFLSYGYNRWEDVQPANAGDLAIPVSTKSPGVPRYISPRDGSLINDHGTVYIISNGYRQGFASEQVFLGLGYSFANALPGDTSFLETYLPPIISDQIPHPSGTIINDGGIICVVEHPFRAGSTPGRRCFSTLADMNSWGIKNSDMVQANSYDRNLQIKTIIPARTPTGLNP